MEERTTTSACWGSWGSLILTRPYARAVVAVSFPLNLSLGGALSSFQEGQNDAILALCGCVAEATLSCGCLKGKPKGHHTCGNLVFERKSQSHVP